MGTGVVAIIKNGTSDRAVGLRADIDALPVTEGNTFAHAIQHPGKMHACGHDGHTAMLLAAAKHLSRHRNFDGTVYLIFQPTEEGGGGAREMIKDGLFKLYPMEAVFGAHNWPGMAVGQFSLKAGPCYASSNEFKIIVKGKGAHAAMPHLGVDPVPAACAMVQGFQTIISRNLQPIDTGVISVTMIHTGEATNVIPETCEVQGMVRTFTTDSLGTFWGIGSDGFMRRRGSSETRCLSGLKAPAASARSSAPRSRWFAATSVPVPNQTCSAVGISGIAGTVGIGQRASQSLAPPRSMNRQPRPEARALRSAVALGDHAGKHLVDHFGGERTR